MSQEIPKWFFPSAGGVVVNSFSDSLITNFAGDRDEAIARETVQNALDAAAQERVRVRFERIDIPTADLPGGAELREAVASCVAYAEKSGEKKSEDFFARALATLDSGTVPCMRISDFGTTGLSGGDDDPKGQWHKLVVAVGRNDPRGAGGGTYGVGKGAPFKASGLRTVYYSTKTPQGVAFQGKARLISFDRGQGATLGIGAYALPAVSEGRELRALRDASLIPKRFLRADQGTDVIVLGYQFEKGWQEGLLGEILENFWLAVHSGSLTVEIAAGEEKPVVVSEATVGQLLEAHSRRIGLPFFKARTEPTRHFTSKLNGVGNVHLWVKVEPGFPRQVMMTRLAKMKVYLYPARVLHEDYAAVFLCDDTDGNRYLASLEPPKHDKWDDKLPESEEGKTLALETMNEIKLWVREQLKSMGEVPEGSVEDIPDVSKYLADDTAGALAKGAGEGRGVSDKKSLDEVQQAVVPTDILVERKELRFRVMRPEGGEETRKGRLRGVKGRRTRKGGGAGLWDEGSLGFRSFSTGEAYTVVVQSYKESPGIGSVQLKGVGDDALYELTIKEATDEATGERLEVAGSSIKNLSIDKGGTRRLKVSFNEKERIAMTIEAEFKNAKQ